MTALRTTMTLCAGALVLAAAAPARAQRPPDPWQVSVHVDVLWHLDAAYDVFSRGTSVNAAPGLSVARDLARGERLSLGLELGWRNETATGRYAQVFDTTFTSHTFYGAVVARYAVWRWFQPYVRVAGGAAYGEATFDPATGGAQLWDAAWSVHGSAGGGILVATGPVFSAEGVRSLGFAVAIEGGMQLGTPYEFGVEPEAPEDEDEAADRIPVRAVPLGTLDPAAPYLRLTAGLRF